MGVKASLLSSKRRMATATSSKTESLNRLKLQALFLADATRPSSRVDTWMMDVSSLGPCSCQMMIPVSVLYQPTRTVQWI